MLKYLYYGISVVYILLYYNIWNNFQFIYGAYCYSQPILLLRLINESLIELSLFKAAGSLGFLTVFL